MHRLIAFAVCMILVAPAMAQRPVFDGITRGYAGATVDITALTSAGKAIGDGVTDASPAFTAALALTGNATVTLPCGTYLLKTTKSFAVGGNNANLSFVGADRNCVTIKFPPATSLTGSVFDFTNGAALKSTWSGITIDLANATSPGTAPVGILSSNQHRLDVLDSAIVNGSAYMFLVIAANQLNGFTVSRSVFAMTNTSFALDGIGCLLVTGSSAPLSSKNGVVSGNQAVNCGFSISGHDIAITGNTFSGWGAAGAAVVVEADANTYNLIIANNISDGLAASGQQACMEIWSKNSTIVGNLLHGCPGSGLDIGAANSVVADNIIFGVGAPVGIVLRYMDATFNGNGSLFHGNTVFDGGGGTLKYGFADQQDASGLGCNASRLCSAILGINAFGGTLGSVQVRSVGDTYAGNQSIVSGGTTGGSANAQTIAAVTTPPIIASSLATGLRVDFVPGFSNTGAATLSVKTGITTAPTDAYTVATKTTGALAINKLSGGSLVPLAGGELLASVPTSVTYNGTVWVWGPR